MRPVLWPMLLSAAMTDEFVHAGPVVCDLILRIAASLHAEPAAPHHPGQPPPHQHAPPPPQPQHGGSYAAAAAAGVPLLAGLTTPLGGTAPTPHALFGRLFLFACSLDWMPTLSERALQVTAISLRECS